MARNMQKQIEECKKTWARRGNMSDGFTISDQEVILKKAPGTGQLPPDAAVLSITIHEGRNRQIRRMAEAAGLRVTRLTRIAEGGVTLGRLKKGTWRYLTNEEIRRLREENQHG